MNRTVFALPARSDYVTRAGLAITRVAEQFTGGANRLDDLVNLLDRRRGVVLSSGTTVPGRYESFDLGFSDPPLKLETTGFNFNLEALNERGQVLIAFVADVLRRALRRDLREDVHAPCRSYRPRRSADRRRPAHAACQRDVAGARSRRRLLRQRRRVARPVRRLRLRPRLPDRGSRAEARARERSARHRALRPGPPAGL
ncbi:hypothetical protein ACVW0I_002172 [Bradyrhizobium sp. LM6.11]